MHSSPTTETSTTAALSERLAEIKRIDDELDSLKKQTTDLEKKRNYLERICVEDMTVGKLDGVRAAGRSWRIEWTHSLSATAAGKQDIIKAMKKMGLDKETLDSLTTINTARLKAILKEEAERRGIDIRQPWSAGTPLEGKAGEYVAPRLRFTTSG